MNVVIQLFDKLFHGDNALLADIKHPISAIRKTLQTELSGEQPL